MVENVDVAMVKLLVVMEDVKIAYHLEQNCMVMTLIILAFVVVEKLHQVVVLLRKKDVHIIIIIVHNLLIQEQSQLSFQLKILQIG
jgi:hypothetical protein